MIHNMEGSGKLQCFDNMVLPSLDYFINHLGSTSRYIRRGNNLWGRQFQKFHELCEMIRSHVRTLPCATMLIGSIGTSPPTLSFVLLDSELGFNLPVNLSLLLFVVPV